MNDKQLFKEFKKISSFKPSQTWKAKNRELLLSQIFSAQEALKPSYFNSVLKGFSLIPQSAMVAVFILAITLSGGFLGLRAAQNTVPGDSLYIAKIAGEKTKLALTFNNKNKARLGLEFAGNRAKEINQVLADTDVVEDKDEKVEKLVFNFHKEINGAKSRLKKINKNSEPANSKKESEKTPVASPENNLAQNQTEENELAKDDSEADDKEPQVFSANLGKDENGLEIYDANAGESGSAVAVEESALADEDVQNASTTDEGFADVSTTNPEEILKQAGDSLDSDDISAALNLIEEAGQVINQIEENSGATSTEDLSGEVLEVEGGVASTSEE